jgi:hypothetical protein
MIYIETINRYWDAGAKMLQGESRQTKKQFQLYLANEYVRLVKLSIDKQRYAHKWKELTPGYIEFKRRHGYSTNIWEATGQLKNSLKVFSKGSSLTIGFDKRISHKGSKAKVYKIAKWMEYGTPRMPPRPLFRVVYMYMSSNMNYFWEKYSREEESR